MQPLNPNSFVASCIFSVLLLCSGDCLAQSNAPTYQTERAIPYRPSGGPDSVLDLYYPTGKKDFPTVIWFHGGGLTSGQRSVPKPLTERGVAVVAVGYRLSPQVKVDDCIDDAAAAVAWTYQNIGQYGGSKTKVFVSGHSAGGYLTSMIGLDKRWLNKYGMDANQLAGLIPFSGHAITHFTARKEQGIPREQPVIDALAPLYHVRKDAPPLFLITGDRELELLGRYEENAYLWRMMKITGHRRTTLQELKGFDHGGMASPAYPLLLDFIRQTQASAEAADD